MTVNVSMPAIVLLNPEDIDRDEDPRMSPYWRENATFVDVINPLFGRDAHTALVRLER